MLFSVWFRCDDPSTAREVEAVHAHDAAERFVAEYEQRNASYPIASGSAEATVCVKRSDELFEVVGASAPSYRAVRL